MTTKRLQFIKEQLEGLALRQWERDEARKRKREEYASRTRRREYHIEKTSRKGVAGI